LFAEYTADWRQCRRAAGDLAVLWYSVLQRFFIGIAMSGIMCKDVSKDDSLTPASASAFWRGEIRRCAIALPCRLTRKSASPPCLLLVHEQRTPEEIMRTGWMPKPS
jgi:hypothetical protein